MTLSDYIMDPADPRAPTEEQWSLMTPEERRAVVEDLPPEPVVVPEGDSHRVPKEQALSILAEHYRRLGRPVYLSSELPVYYPDEDMLAPDLIAVLDVETHQRAKWDCSVEGRGIDLALEIALRNYRIRKLKDHVPRYARFGIPEYFVFDVHFQQLLAYRLEQPEDRTYRPVAPRDGRFPSRVLGLDLAVEDNRLCFYHGSELLPATDEIIARLTTRVDEVLSREGQLERQLQAERRRAEKAEQRVERLAARLRELGEDPES